MAPPARLGQVLRDAIESHLSDTHTALPGRIESYSVAQQKASVKPLINRGWTDEENNRQSDELPVINDVPIVFPGGGGFRVTFPITKGDTCLLIFSSSSLDKWLQKGGVVDPEDDRRHDLNDCIAIPGLRPFSGPLATANASMMTAGSDAGVQIFFDLAQILIGGLTALPVIKATPYTTAEATLLGLISAFMTAVDTAIQACSGPSPTEKAAVSTASTAFSGAGLTAFAAAVATSISTVAKVV